MSYRLKYGDNKIIRAKKIFDPKYYYICLLALLSGISCMHAEEYRDSAEIRFHVSRSNLDLSLDSNSRHLDRMLDFLSVHESADSIFRIKRINVSGAASPEGPDNFNISLSHRRADAIFDYFRTRTELPDSATRFVYKGRDWQGLYDMVVADTLLPYHTEILEILYPVGEGGDISAQQGDVMLRRLKSLHGGAPYSYMLREMFPSLRRSTLTVSYDKINNPLLIPSLRSGLTGPDIVPVLDDIVVTGNIYGDVVRCRPFYMALKTNMLFDALALPNISAEFYLGKNLSISGNWMYGWWDNDRRHDYWRAYGGDITLRYWFGKASRLKPLTGHHIGIYGGVVTYDFELGGKGYMGGRPGHSLWDRCMHVAGVEYGYSLPVARRLNIDFTIGIGYMGGLEEKYEPAGDKYEWISTNRRTWIGPTKAEISLVWLIGCSNYNIGKR